MLIRIVFTGIVLCFAQAAIAQNNQSDSKIKPCNYELKGNFTWDYDTVDSLVFLAPNCTYSKPEVILFNRWGQKIVNKKRLALSKEMFETRPATGTYFGVYNFINKDGEAKEQRFTLTII
jgi:hypothetical protein